MVSYDKIFGRCLITPLVEDAEEAAFDDHEEQDTVSGNLPHVDPSQPWFPYPDKEVRSGDHVAKID